MLGAPIQLDTFLFNPLLKDKIWFDEDKKAHQFLLKYAKVGKKFAMRLKRCKYDVKKTLELGLAGIFARDYKTF